MYAEWQIRGVGSASLVQLRISEQLIRAILRLPGGVTVHAAAITAITAASGFRFGKAP